jgi:hypothetical protein
MEPAARILSFEPGIPKSVPLVDGMPPAVEGKQGDEPAVEGNWEDDAHALHDSVVEVVPKGALKE